jgi:hypothetical protein
VRLHTAHIRTKYRQGCIIVENSQERMGAASDGSTVLITLGEVDAVHLDAKCFELAPDLLAVKVVVVG